MTVTLSKRLFEESAIGSGCLSSPPASKKLRALTPLADHLTSCHVRPAAAGLTPLQQHHHSSARKRRHDTAADSTSGAASPSTGLKRVSCVFHSAFEAAGGRGCPYGACCSPYCSGQPPGQAPDQAAGMPVALLLSNSVGSNVGRRPGSPWNSCTPQTQLNSIPTRAVLLRRCSVLCAGQAG